MARTASQTNHVSLFPFLAVLVCAMGALIFLLLVTTRQIRRGALERAQTPVSAVDSDVQHISASPSFSALTEPRGFAISGRLPEDPDVLHPQPVPTPTVEPEVIDRSLEWQQRVAELERELRRLGATLQQRQAGLTEKEQRARLKQRRLEALARELQLAHQTLRQKATASRKIVQAGGQLEEQIDQLQRQIEDSKLKPASASTRFAFLPFDGETGTVRRPILIECTSEGFVFRPEGVSLVKSDFNGFVPEFNPLLGGAQALIRYWKIQDRGQKDSYGEPYVLLVVRPGGTVPYYVARRMLAGLGADFGYELIEDDAVLDLPVVDQKAQQVCRAAVDQILARRDQLAAQLEQQMHGSRGGRNGLPDWRGGVGNGSGSSGEPGESGSGRGGRSIRLDANGTIVVTDPEQVELESHSDDPDQWGEFVSRGRRSREGLDPAESQGDSEHSTTDVHRPAGGRLQTAGAAERATQGVGVPSTSESGGDLAETGRRPDVQGRGTRDARSDALTSGVNNNRDALVEGPTRSGLNGGHPPNRETGAPVSSRAIPGDEWGPSGDSHAMTRSRNSEIPGGDPNPNGVSRVEGHAPSLTPAPHGPDAGRTQRGRRQTGVDARVGETQFGATQEGATQRGGDQQTSLRGNGQPATSQIRASGAVDRASGGHAITSPGSTQSGPPSSLPLGSGPPQVHLGNRREASADRSASDRRRRWGVPSLGGTIGYEREVKVQVHTDRVEVGRYYIRLQRQVSRQELEAAVADLIDLQARTWGAPPNGFYWVPTVSYQVHPGAQQQYERLYGITHGLGLAAKAQMVGPPPSGTSDAAVDSASNAKE